MNWVLTQEHGQTSFSDPRPALYGYSRSYCRDWCPDPNGPFDPNGPEGRCWWGHPGLDIGIPFGTPLFAPAAGTVICAGTGTGCAAFPCDPPSGAARSGRFELKLEENGDRLIYGHMASVEVRAGDQLNPGDFVGLSGRDNGDHLHLEYRQLAPECTAEIQMRIVDPRTKFPS